MNNFKITSGTNQNLERGNSDSQANSSGTRPVKHVPSSDVAKLRSLTTLNKNLLNHIAEFEGNSFNKTKNKKLTQLPNVRENNFLRSKAYLRPIEINSKNYQEILERNFKNSPENFGDAIDFVAKSIEKKFTNIQETSIQETSIQETSIQETSIDETSIDETSIHETFFAQAQEFIGQLNEDQRAAPLEVLVKHAKTSEDLAPLLEKIKNLPDKERIALLTKMALRVRSLGIYHGIMEEKGFIGNLITEILGIKDPTLRALPLAVLSPSDHLIIKMKFGRMKKSLEEVLPIISKLPEKDQSAILYCLIPLVASDAVSVKFYDLCNMINRSNDTFKPLLIKQILGKIKIDNPAMALGILQLFIANIKVTNDQDLKIKENLLDMFAFRANIYPGNNDEWQSRSGFDKVVEEFKKQCGSLGPKILQTVKENDGFDRMDRDLDTRSNTSEQSSFYRPYRDQLHPLFCELFS